MMVGGRFILLCREPDTILTVGIVGQFWRLSGGEDAAVDSAAAFVAFDQLGFVKSAIDFELERTERGTRLTTVPAGGPDLHSARGLLACHSRPELVDHGVPLIGTLLEGLVSLLGQQHVLGAGDAVGDGLAQLGRCDEVAATSYDEGGRVDVVHTFDRLV